MDQSKKLTTGSLRQCLDEDDDDVSVIAVIQVDKDVPPKAANPPQTSSSTVQGAVQVSYRGRPEVILLDQRPHEQSCRRGETQHVNRCVIDLSDKQSKMALREQLRLEPPTAEPSDEDGAGDYGGMDILQKLPSDTIVIKRDARMQKEDSDYVRDSTETNSSGGSSSTSGYAAGKVKRIHRVIRSKNRNTVEVRRNPMRVTKKDTEKETSRSRQRLLSAKRKEAQAAPESKRVKLSTMPYMNTRSVTRKMYTVGAIYQAPTIKDMKERKEWPVHGMHERPVFHPQVGLATEFMGRYFISLDGLSYREIVDHPGANTITSDPYFICSRPNRSCQENRGKLKVRSSASKKVSQDTPEEDKSFAGYMHRSLHYVLAYCAQVMTPAYRKNVRDKIKILQRDGTLPSTTADSEQTTNAKELNDGGLKRSNYEQNSSTVVSEQKQVLEQKQIDNYTVAMPQTAKELNPHGKVLRQSQTSMVYLADPQKNLITLKNLRAIRGSQLIFQNVRPIQKNSLVFVKGAGMQSASLSREQVCKTVSHDLNFTKLEDTAISDDALMEMSSVYTNYAPSDNVITNDSPLVNFSRRVAPKILVKPDNLTVPKRVVIDRPYDRRDKENQPHIGNYNVKNISRVSETSTSSNTGTTWYTNDASEIAKILSEYNRSIARKSAIQNTFLVAPTNVQKPNLLRMNQRVGRLEMQGNNESQGYPGHSFNLPNQGAIKLSQDKWRRFYPTVEIANEPSGSYKVGVQSGSVPFEHPPLNLRSVNQETITRYAKVNENFSSSSSTQPRQTFMKSVKPNLNKRECEKDSDKLAEMDALQELLENTAMLYCAATGTHQDDLATYIDSLDAKQSIQWLDMVDPVRS